MSDVTKLLESNVDDVKVGLAGLSHDDLLKLKAAETDGKKRSGVLDALNDAIAAADAARAQGFTQQSGAANPPAIAAQLDTSDAANIPAADTFDPSGAPQQVVPDVDINHPAVDNDPRAGTTELQNRIDFNDPTKPGHEAVADMLAGKN